MWHGGESAMTAGSKGTSSRRPCWIGPRFGVLRRRTCCVVLRAVQATCSTWDTESCPRRRKTTSEISCGSSTIQPASEKGGPDHHERSTGRRLVDRRGG